MYSLVARPHDAATPYRADSIADSSIAFMPRSATVRHIRLGEELVLTVRAADGQYHLDTGVVHDNPWPDSVDGLTTGEAGWMAVITGVEWGPIAVRVQVRHAAPAGTDLGWDMVAERDLIVGGRGIAINEIYEAAPGYVCDAAPGLHRVRVSVRGRGAQHGEGGESVEQHFLQIWPASSPTQPSTVHGPDRYGELYLHPPAGHAETATEVAAVDAVRQLRALADSEPPPTFTGEVTTVEVSATVDASVRDAAGVFTILHIWLGMGGRPGFGVGQQFSIYIDPVGGLSASGEVTRRADHGIDFTWSWTGRSMLPATMVELRVSADGDRAQVRVHHRDVPVELAASTAALWRYYLPRLDAHAHGQHPGLHPWVER